LDGRLKPGVPQVFRLPYFQGDWRGNCVYDPMHCLGGLMKDTFLGTLTGVLGMPQGGAQA